jgi:multidrug efflux pump subunit AcrA (membrane-fusion protein)
MSNETEKNMMNLHLRFFIVFSVAVCMVTGCARKPSNDDEESQNSTPPLVTVKTAFVTEGPVDVVVAATGKTNALREEKIFSPIAGKILSLKVLEGTSVKKGSVLATIQTKESQAAVDGAEALLRDARTAQESTEAKKALQLSLSTQSVVSVRAKFDGVVSSRNVIEGELATENEELLTLLDLSTLVFNASVTLSDLPSIHIGQRCIVRFQSMPAFDFKATVDAVSPRTDLQSQAVQVRLRFSELSPTEKPLLKTDMIGTANIVAGIHKNALIIPKSALLRNDETNTYSVVVMTADSLAQTVPVTVGSSTDSTVEIRGNTLRKGTIVITEGNYALADSTKVTVVK